MKLVKEKEGYKIYKEYCEQTKTYLFYYIEDNSDTVWIVDSPCCDYNDAREDFETSYGMISKAAIRFLAKNIEILN